jgi:hypothetical protein
VKLQGSDCQVTVSLTLSQVPSVLRIEAHSMDFGAAAIGTSRLMSIGA